MLRSFDVRHALPLIQAPTLVLHARENRFVPIAHGRYLADHINGASFVELAGGDSGTNPVVATEVAEFLTGDRPVVEIERILTTVLFTDIVGSTAIAASVGDHRWHLILDAHDQTVRQQLKLFRGREINTTGDGFVASFDGPARAIRCAQAISEATETLGVRPDGWDCTPASARFEAMILVDWRSTSPPGSTALGRVPGRCPGLGDCEGSGCGVGDRVLRSWRARSERHLFSGPGNCSQLRCDLQGDGSRRRPSPSAGFRRGPVRHYGVTSHPRQPDRYPLQQ